MSRLDRMREALERFLEARLGARIDRCALYPGRVVSQAANGQLEVQLDDARWPSLTKVPIRTFVPGAIVKVLGGARVLVGWEEADPRKPYAALWEPGTPAEGEMLPAPTSLDELDVPVQSAIKLAGATDFVALAALVKSRLDQIQAMFDAHVHSGGTISGNTGAPTATIGSLGDVAASKVMAE